MPGPWTCDTCGQQIRDAEDGMLQWLVRREGRKPVGRDLKLVHKRHKSPLGGPNGCYPDETAERRRDGSTLSDWELKELLRWEGGIVRLLTLTETGEFSPHPVNRMLMRLFIPNYEQARLYFVEAVERGIIEPNLPKDYFFPDQLRSIVAAIDDIEADR